jgi:hypothetical protein
LMRAFCDLLCREMFYLFIFKSFTLFYPALVKQYNTPKLGTIFQGYLKTLKSYYYDSTRYWCALNTTTLVLA